MRSVDLSHSVQPLAANLVYERTVLLRQVQLGLAHDNTSKHRVKMTRVYSCLFIYGSEY